MTVVVIVNVEARYRGFLASTMLEIAPGVYTSPRMTSGIRERIWGVLSDWYHQLWQGAIVMTWHDPAAPGQQRIRTLGAAPKDHSRCRRSALGKVQLAPLPGSK